MIRTNRLVSIHYLKPENHLNLNFFDHLYLSTDQKIIENFFTPKEIIPVIGQNEYNSIKENGIFIYSGIKVETDEKNFNERAFLLNYLVLVEFFCQSLWLIKDNSIHSELGHLVYQTDSKLSVHSNLWHSSYTNCLGKRNNTVYTSKELEQALKLMPLVFSIHYVGEDLSNSSVKVTSKVSRLARAFYFLQSARNVEDIGTKLSHYCSVFESIFSSSTTELKHRLSETVAFFLETEHVKRVDVYKTLQMAYDIRSSIVHGDGVSTKFLKNEFELLLQTSIKTDEILRRCIRKIISNDKLLSLFTEKPKDDVNSFCQDLIFGNS